MTEKRKSPTLRFRGYSDDWEQRKLIDEVASIDTGKSKFTPQESGQYEILGSTSVIGYDDTYDYEGDFLLTARVGANAGELYRYSGKVKISDNTVFIKGEQLDFVYYALLHFDIKRLSFGTGQPLVKASELKVQEIMMPVEDTERTVIGEYFANLDNLITLHQCKLDKLKLVKKSMLEKMFPKNGSSVPEIRFNGFTDDWEQRKVSQLFKVTRGYVLAATLTEPTKTGGMPYPVYSSQTKDNGLMGYYKDYLYEDAITWTTDGANAGTVNYRAGKFYCTNVCGVLLSNEVKANQMIAEALNNVAKGYVSYVGNPKLMNNVMSDIEIQLPRNEEEREKISAFFVNLDHLITLHQRKVEKLQILKKSMLEKMFV